MMNDLTQLLTFITIHHLYTCAGENVYTPVYGSTMGDIHSFYAANSIYIYQISISYEQGSNIDIDGIRIRFRNEQFQQWNDGTAQNWGFTNAGSSPSCFSGVRVNADGVVHGLQFRSTHEDPGWGGWMPPLGDLSSYHEYFFGDHYCMNYVSIYAGPSSMNAIQFGFDVLPTPSPTGNPTKRPTPYPTPRPIPHPTPYPTPGPTQYPTSFPTDVPSQSPISAPTSNPVTATPTSPDPFVTQYSPWYGSTTSTENYQQFYYSNIIYIHQIGVSSEQGINTDIDGIRMWFRNGRYLEWNDGSANWQGAINAANTPNCFTGVRVNGASSGVIHGLQFRGSHDGWFSWYGDDSTVAGGVIDEYWPGDNYCMNSIEIYAGDSYLEGIRFGFDKLPSSTEYSEWYGSTTRGSYKQFFQATTIYIYQIGASSEQGINTDIDGIRMWFRNGIFEQWDDGSANNWVPDAINAANTPNCFTGVRINGAASGVIHGLQFRGSHFGWSEWYGDGSNYVEYWPGDNYCMNSVEMYGDHYMYGIRFGFAKVSGRRLLLNYAQ